MNINFAIKGLAALGLSFFITGTVYANDILKKDVNIADMLKEEPGVSFDIGTFNSGYAAHFTGDSYLNTYQQGIPVANVTFVDGAHTHWHKHGTEQMLVAESGVGYYQLDGQEPVKLLPGTVVVIPQNTKHWHGAAPHHTFQHLSIMKERDDMTTTWFEPVNQEEYDALESR